MTDIFDALPVPITLWGTARSWTPREPDLTVHEAPASEVNVTNQRNAARPKRKRVVRVRHDMVGRRIGGLVVLRRDERVPIRVAWVCRCDCGAEVTRRGDRLVDSDGQWCSATCPARRK